MRLLSSSRLQVFAIGLCGLLTLTACSEPDANPPAISISSPAVGQTVSGTTQVQLSARDDSGIAKVSLYARGKGSSAEGVFVGSATAEPYVVSWATTAFPNQAELELYAKAEDSTGNFSQSDPTWVKTSNTASPSMSYLVGYTLPQSAIQTQSATAPNYAALATKLTPTQTILPPPNLQPTAVSRTSLSAQAATDRAFVIRFGWAAVQGATGYRIWQSDKEITGPYKTIRNQLSVGSGIQEYTPTLATAKAGDRYWGAITAVVNSSEGNYSNADDTTLLPAQLVTSPAENSTADARPRLSWKATEGAQGYLFYISKKNQEEATAADWVCTNAPYSTDRTEANYPSSCPALTPGTYYWWVAGIAFNSRVEVDAYTFSDSTRFMVQ